ncbi:hypothetical protein BC828DRAFT_391367 [Blastocladiella britannica]|nr:hypothetical protein BC828DRAFT_391367 [Blastocladiella britannica]
MASPPQSQPLPVPGDDLIVSLAAAMARSRLSGPSAPSAAVRSSGASSVMSFAASFRSRATAATTATMGMGMGLRAPPVVLARSTPDRRAPSVLSVRPPTTITTAPVSATIAESVMGVGGGTLAGGATGGGGSSVGRASLDPVHFAYLETRFRQSPAVCKYLGLPSPTPAIPVAATHPTSTAPGTAPGPGWGSWFWNSSASSSSGSSSSAQRAQAERSLLLLFQLLEGIHTLRIAPSSRRPIAGFQPNPHAPPRPSSLANVTTLEFKGTRPAEVMDLTDLCAHITVLLVQSDLDSVAHALVTTQTWTRLAVLDLSNNALSDLEVTALARAPHLTELILQNNAITALPPSLASALPHLVSLDLSFNRMTTFLGDNDNNEPPLLPWLHLQRLNVYGNRLETLDHLATHFPALIELVAAKNYIHDLSGLQGMVDLSAIQLVGNPVAESSTYRADAERALGRSAHVVLDGQRLANDGEIGGDIEGDALPTTGSSTRRGPHRHNQPHHRSGVKMRVVSLDLATTEESPAESSEDPPPTTGRLITTTTATATAAALGSTGSFPPSPLATAPAAAGLHRTSPAFSAPVLTSLGSGPMASSDIVDPAAAEERSRRRVELLKRERGADWARAIVQQQRSLRRPQSTSSLQAPTQASAAAVSVVQGPPRHQHRPSLDNASASALRAPSPFDTGSQTTAASRPVPVAAGSTLSSSSSPRPSSSSFGASTPQVSVPSHHHHHQLPSPPTTHSSPPPPLPQLGRPTMVGTDLSHLPSLTAPPDHEADGAGTSAGRGGGGSISSCSASVVAGVTAATAAAGGKGGIHSKSPGPHMAVSSALAGEAREVPVGCGWIAHHTKPALIPKKRVKLDWVPLEPGWSLARLNTGEIVAAVVLMLPGTSMVTAVPGAAAANGRSDVNVVVAHLTMRASRGAPVAYVSIKLDLEDHSSLPPQNAAAMPTATVEASSSSSWYAGWCAALDRSARLNLANAHVDATCARAECVVCGRSGYVPHPAPRTLAPQTPPPPLSPPSLPLTSGREVVPDEEEVSDDLLVTALTTADGPGLAQAVGASSATILDGRAGAYLAVRRRGKASKGTERLVCGQCGAVVSVFYGAPS